MPTFTITLVREKETKNTIRYQEVVTEQHPPLLRTLYVERWAVAQLGHPDTLRVTIQAE